MTDITDNTLEEQFQVQQDSTPDQRGVLGIKRR